MIKYFCTIITFFSLNTFAKSYWLFGYEKSISKRIYYLLPTNIELKFEENSFFTGKSNDNFDLLISYGNSYSQNEKLTTLRFLFEPKLNILDKSNFNLFIGYGIIYDSSSIEDSTSNLYTNNSFLGDLNLNLRYVISEGFSINSKFTYQKNLVNISNTSENKALLSFDDLFLTSLSLGINFDKIW